MRSFVFMLLALALLTACERRPAEILVTSQPDQADIILRGAKIGVTPMKVAIREETPIEIRRNGFLPRMTTLRPDGDPNVIILLEAVAPAPQAVAENRVAKPASSAHGLRELKEMYRAGKIDKVEYNRRVNQVRAKYETEIKEVKVRYRRGEIDRSEYERRVRQLKSDLNS